MKKVLSFTIVMLCFSLMINAQTRADGCNTNTPGWGTSLGTVSFASDGIWTITGQGITQIWSDAVTATACQKTTFNGGNHRTQNFNADCRSNPSQRGDLFSWCAVVRFQNQLCPAPWRVPTVQDFIDLDIAMGGIGEIRFDAPQFVQDNYITRWGGHFGGFCRSGGRLRDLGDWGNYWSQTEFDAVGARRLGFCADGVIGPQIWRLKNYGLSLRCVR